MVYESKIIGIMWL